MNRRDFLRISTVAVAVGIGHRVFTFADDTPDISLDKMKQLAKGHELLVAFKDGSIKTYGGGGVKPIFNRLQEGDFKDTYVFDKVTGKASALLLAYGKASKLYTGILSKEALPVLEKYKIEYNADKIVDYIINKTGDDKCPMEKSITNTDDPKEAYTILKEKFGN
jgi:hypothetical protein